MFVIDGMRKPIPMGLVAAAGKPPEEIRVKGVHFDGAAPQRLGSRRPGSPTRTATASPPRSSTRRSACSCATTTTPTTSRRASRPTTAGSRRTATAHPARLLGCGQTAMRSPEEGIADLHEIRALGLRGVMMPGMPGCDDDYDSPVWDPFWEAAIELGLPLSFHILTTQATRHPRPEDERVPVDRARLPGHHGDARARRRVRAPPGPAGRVRRGRRRLGAALHVPDGPRLQAAPLLAAGRPAAVDAAVASTSPTTSTSRSRTTGRRSSRPTT